MKIKKINKSFFLILIFLSSMVLCFASPKTKVLIPKNAKTSISIMVSNKSLKYYPLSFDESSVLTTRGPGKLKIITRGHLKSEDEKNFAYSVYYRIDGTKK
jgi:hypothetical protein